MDNFLLFENMGQCTGGRSKPSPDGGDCYWKEPPHTEKYADRILPKLQFEGSLANFKIKNCVYVRIGGRSRTCR